MSKLSRREFKELLTEWNSNFINEREIIQPVAFSRNFAGQISDEDIEDLKSQNYPAYLMILPTVNRAELSNIYNYKDKSKNTYEKSESNYNLIKNKIIIGQQNLLRHNLECMLNEIYRLFLLRYKIFLLVYFLFLLLTFQTNIQ